MEDFAWIRSTALPAIVNQTLWETDVKVVSLFCIFPVILKYQEDRRIDSFPTIQRQKVSASG